MSAPQVALLVPVEPFGQVVVVEGVAVVRAVQDVILVAAVAHLAGQRQHLQCI